MKNFFRSLFFVVLACVPAALGAQTDFRKLSENEAAAVLEEFRAARPSGDICLKFDITHYPRKDDATKVFAGTLYGTWTERVPVLRVEIAPKDDPAAKKSFILRSGKSPEMWTLDAGKNPVRVDGNVDTPFFDGLIFTPFDLQTPFVHWADARYEKTRRFRGRPVHFFKMVPPADFVAKNPEIGFVRIGFDRVYAALVSAEIFDGNGKTKKNFSLSRVQKVQGQYMIRELDLRDEISRDRDELIVRSAALDLRLPRETFDPDSLSAPPPRVPAVLFSEL